MAESMMKGYHGNINDEKRVGRLIDKWLVNIAGKHQVPTTLLSVTAFPSRGVIMIDWGGEQPIANGVVFEREDGWRNFVIFDDATMRYNEAVETIVYSSAVLAKNEYPDLWNQIVSGEVMPEVQLTLGRKPLANKLPVHMYEENRGPQ